MQVKIAHSEDWALSIDPGTTIDELISALQTLPHDLVVQKDYTRALSGATIIAFERLEDRRATT